MGADYPQTLQQCTYVCRYWECNSTSYIDLMDAKHTHTHKRNFQNSPLRLLDSQMLVSADFSSKNNSSMS